MEGLFSILGFSVGASLGAAVARGLGNVARPLVVGTFRAGLAAGDAARTTVGSLATTVATAASGARENLSDITAEAKRERSATAEGHDAPARRIEVATE